MAGINNILLIKLHRWNEGGEMWFNVNNIEYFINGGLITTSGKFYSVAESADEIRILIQNAANR